MRYKQEPNSLYLYIALSLIIHLLFLIIVPYGRLSVMGSSPDGQGQGYGFIQLVEYRGEISDRRSQSESRENTQARTVVEKKEPEPEIQEIREEREEVRREEVISPPAKTTVVKEETPPAPVEESPVEKIEETLVEKSPAIDDGAEILTSEESDLEIEINVETRDEPDKQVRESSPAVEEKTETPPPPPPPPSAGELIFGAAPITYPKDMVGQAVTGTVEIQVHISSSGLIEAIEINKSSGIEQMDRVARLTIEHGWQFRQYQQPYSMTITVDFQIDEAGNPDVKVSQGNLVFR